MSDNATERRREWRLAGILFFSLIAMVILWAAARIIWPFISAILIGGAAYGQCDPPVPEGSCHPDPKAHRHFDLPGAGSSTAIVWTVLASTDVPPGGVSLDRWI